MKAVIMAAGKSTRTVPLTLTRPKPLLPVANKPIAEHQLDALHGIIDEAIFVVGYMQDMLRAHLGDSYRGIAIRYVEQTEQLGTGHAILQCQSRIDGSFLAMNGDDLYAPGDIARLAAEPQGALVKEVDDPRLFGVYEVDGNENVTDLVEKPAHPKSNLANLGVYKFGPSVFDELAKTGRSERGEIEITSAILPLAKAGAFKVVRAEGYWLPIGFAWHLLDANAYMLAHHLDPVVEGTIHPSAVIDGPIRLGKNSVIRSGVVIEGPVCIGDDCVVGPNAYLRPGTTLGNHCKVGQACELKNTILFDGAHVPHLSYVGDSVIGAKTNLGAGTITANLRHDGKGIRSEIKGDLIDSGRRKFGAIIGDDVHTGINTSILPGRKLWPHTGTAPGSVVTRDVLE